MTPISRKRWLILSTVHARNDTRIVLKEARSLSRISGDLTLAFADGLGDSCTDFGVPIHDLRVKKGSRILRAIMGNVRAYRFAREGGYGVVHFHDPELLVTGLLLRWKGHVVIYDVHEDVPGDILTKDWIPGMLRRPISFLVDRMETFCDRQLSAIVAATPTIARRFSPGKTVVVQNFPIEQELESEFSWSGKRTEISYIGGMSAQRGLRELVQAMALTRSAVRLNLGGSFQPKEFEGELGRLGGWDKVSPLGFLSRPEVKAVLARSMAGLVTLHPVPTFLASLPIKMFEYMSAGLPVIASDFPLWREIIEGNDCGLCVDPLDPQAIADAIDHLVEHPEVARRMGENGRKAVVERYNWAVEEKKLIALYERLPGGGKSDSMADIAQ